MITRCPDCQTAFRVTAAQLTARDGQVRCGSCTHVFDAAAHLLQDAPAATPGLTTEASHPDDAPPAVWPEPAAEDRPADPPASGATTSELNFGPSPLPPRRRGLWVTASFLLMLLLIAQGLFHFRSDIALAAPESKPLLAKACDLLGCTLSLPRRSELMSIEASDLQADAANPNVVILTATLRNRAAFAQANPALELTLTDAQDLPLARRVLYAGDYLDATPDTAGGFAAGAERAIRLTLQLADIKATGYRLYLFYP